METNKIDKFRSRATAVMVDFALFRHLDATCKSPRDMVESSVSILGLVLNSSLDFGNNNSIVSLGFIFTMSGFH